LTADQTARLRHVKLPEAARPAVEDIAKLAIAQAGENYPQSVEMRAAMKLLRDKTRALRSAIAIATNGQRAGSIWMARPLLW
jgi:hypothetical protein